MVGEKMKIWVSYLQIYYPKVFKMVKRNKQKS